MKRSPERGAIVPELIDATADVQMEPSALSVRAGVADLKLLYRSEGMTLPVSLTIQTPTGLHRGVHMSRLVHATSAKSRSVEGWLRSICREVNKTQSGASVVCKVEIPYADQFAKVVMRMTQRGRISYTFTATGMTACPCSKKMIGVGHMQRAEIDLVVRSGKPVDMGVTIGKLEECFSAMPREEMKRLQEAKKILEAQDNPKFAEDLVRECISRFPNALFVRARCFESIHAHDAVASWSRKPGWVPEF